MRVKPTSDPSRATVRDPKTMRPIPEGGIEVPSNSIFWRRRVLQGDVEIVSSSSAVTSGGTHVVSGGTIHPVISGTVVTSGATHVVSSGGTTAEATVVSGGSDVTSGGSITSGGSAA